MLPRTALLLFATFTASVFAAEKIDLDRITPVAADQPIPVQDFFRPLLFKRPVLNTAGSHFVAMVDTGKDHTALMICDLRKNVASTLKGDSNKDITWLTWLDDEHILMNLIADKQYADGLFVTDVNDVSDNYAIERYSATSLVGVPQGDRMKPIVWIYSNAYDDGKDFGVVQLDGKKGLDRNIGSDTSAFQVNRARAATDTYGTKASISRSFAKLPDNHLPLDYLTDKDGNLAFAIGAFQGVDALFRLEGNAWKKCPVDLDLIKIIGAGDQPNELIVAGPREEGVRPRAVQKLDAVTGQLGEVLFQDKNYDLIDVGLYRHPVSHTVLGIKFDRSGLQTVWFSEAYRAVQKILTGYFPGQIVSILGSDLEENRFFVGAFSDKQPITYYMMDLKAGTLGLIKNAAPWIDAKRMQAMNIIKFKTRDGLQLEAYLTLPAGTSKQNPAPLVVLPHGGPWARDSWGFDSEAQFLASRGYAVLQPNYRGSTGANWKFPEADTWAFRKMHDDVTDAVKTVTASGLVDPKRMAIMGTSFGGYLALCGATFEPELYRCAITVAGVFDWETMVKRKKQDQFENPTFGLFLRNLGDPQAEQEKFAAISPLRHVDQIRVPVFVAHGKDDQIVDVAESRRLIAELNRQKIPNESLLVRDEGHGMSNLANEVELYSRIEVFLAKYLQPATP